jgi:hypothetical protein
MRALRRPSFIASRVSSLGSFVVGVACVAFLAGGCGRLKPTATPDGDVAAPSDAGADGAAEAADGRVLVTISGAAAPHPLDMPLGGAVDFSQLKIAIVNPTSVISNPNAPPLASAALDTSAANCGATGCAFSLPMVDITDLTLGLVLTLEDTRPDAARLFLKTGTGMGTAAFLKAVRASRSPITERRAFVVTRAAEAKLAAYAGAMLGATFAAGDLEARGFLIGHVVGRLSDGPVPAGVAGATVTAMGAFDVIYPTADFMGKGSSTSASGIFLMIPKLVNGQPAPVVTSWTVNPPAGDTRTWEVHLAGSNPKNAFVIIMPADEAPGDGGLPDGATTDGGDAPASDGAATDGHADGGDAPASDAGVGDGASDAGALDGATG